MMPRRAPRVWEGSHSHCSRRPEPKVGNIYVTKKFNISGIRWVAPVFGSTTGDSAACLRSKGDSATTRAMRAMLRACVPSYTLGGHPEPTTLLWFSASDTRRVLLSHCTPPLPAVHDLVRNVSNLSGAALTVHIMGPKGSSSSLA